MTGFSVKSNFFCVFKTGDNINYNLKTLCYLYDQYNRGDLKTKNLLIKPIVIWLISIVEAILADFHKRISTNNIEGITNMSDLVINYIRSKKIDELEKYIVSARKHDFFDLKDTKFYHKLDKLRSVRNRIHIQNSKFFGPKNESDVFIDAIKIFSERCVEIVVKTMSRKYSRPNSVATYVDDMFFPWNEYYPTK